MADDFDADAAVRAYMTGSVPKPETALRATLQDTVGQNPDQAAEWRRTAATIGVPIDTAKALPDWSKQQVALQQIDTSALSRMNPVTTAFLTDPTNAAIAHDDVGDMSLIETLSNSFRRGVPGLKQTIAGTMLRVNSRDLEQFDMIAASLDAGASPSSIRAADDPMGVAFMTPDQRAQFRQRISTPLAGNIATVAQTQKDRQAIPQPDVVGKVLDAKTFGAAFTAFMAAPVQFIASIGPESLVTSAPGLVAAIPAGMAAGPAGAAAALGAGSFATDYGSSIVEALGAAGVDVSNPDALAAATQNGPLMRDVAAQAFAHASVVGSVDAVSGGLASKLVLPKAMAARLATKPLARELANVGIQVPVQGALGGLGEAGGELAAGRDLQPGNILAEIVGEAFTAPAEIGSVAGRRVMERIQEGRTAEAAAVRIEQAVKLAEASKLRARDPETFKAFIDQVSEGGDTPTEFYIDPEQLANTLNQSAITMQELEALAPSLAFQMKPENFVPGADLRLSTADLLTAPSEISAALIDHLRTSEDAMTRAEAAQYLEAKGPAIQKEVEAELGKFDARTQYQAEVDGIRDQFQAQLDAAGKFTAEVNKTYATLLGNFYAAQAQRAGVPAQELMSRYQLNITAQTPTYGNTLNAEGGQAGDKPRATLSFADDISKAPSVIALLAGANYSSTIHESGHFFLEVQNDLASRIQTQINAGATVTPGEQQIVADMGKVLDYFGIVGTPEQSAMDTWFSMSLEEKREFHETFARSFEAYAMSGKAPSEALEGVFQRFRAWLVSVYKTLAGLNVNLSDDVRAVFDRMLATDAAIQEAQDARNMGPLFQTAEQAGMTPEQFAEYQGLGQFATDQATEELDARLLKDMKWLSRARDKALKARQKEVAGLRLDIRNQVAAEVGAEPVYRAWAFLTGKYDQLAPGTVAPENIDTTMQSGRLRGSVVKEMSPELYQGLKERRMTAENSGMHPDIVAELFGFASGQEMMGQLATVLPANQLIDDMTDQRMLAEHGDITSKAELDRAADEAVHNELRARVIATELKALERATTVRESTNSLYAGGTVDVVAQAARSFAAEIIGRITLKNLRPKQYAAAEARSAKLAQQNLGNVAEAAMHKRNQLVNNFAAKAAYDAQAEITEADTFFKKVLKDPISTVAKTRDAGTVQAARAILAAYGIGSKGEPAQTYLKTLAGDDPGMYSVLRDKIDALTSQAKSVELLTVSEFRALTDEIKGLWFQAKRSRQVEIEGKLVDIDEAKNALIAKLVERGVPEARGTKTAVTESERNLTKLQTVRAALRRVEAWAQARDGSKGIGPFRRYIFQPVKEAADNYRADKAKYIKAYKQLLETLDLGKAKIEAPELGYTFGFSRGGSGKAELLHAILHTGNGSNKRKMLLGRGWAVESEENRELDTTKWDAFVTRMIREKVLTKADFDFAQGVWDLLEGTKALAQKTHRTVFGNYFDEVTADAFSNEFGSYRGGYVPAMMDPEVVADAATRAIQEDEQQTLAYAFPSTQKGFTKARVEHNKPLLLDLRSLASHIDKVLLFSHMEPAVRDVRKILGSKEVSEIMHRADPAAYDGLLTPWLNRAARQVVETKVPGDNGTLRFFSKLRQRAGLAAMFGNISNTAQQITGFSIAALKVKPRHLGSALVSYLQAPRQTAKTVAEASIYMAGRMDNEVNLMTDAINEILLNPNLYEKSQQWVGKHGYFLQSAFDNVMGPIIWTGAYNQALEAGEGTDNARRLADSAVRETQGSTLPEDVARAETGHPFVRMFTQFAGYFNMQANLLGTEFINIYHELGLRSGMGKGLMVFTLGFLVPAMVAEIIRLTFNGGPDDEDKDGEIWDDWLMAIGVRAPIKGVFAFVPGLGQTMTAGMNATNDKPYDDRISLSPAVSMLESGVVGNVKTLTQLATGAEMDGRRVIRDLATLISLTTGLPATAVARPIGYITGVSQNRIAPTSTADAVRGVITGTPSQESKQ